MHSGDVGQFGRPTITLNWDVNVVKLVFGSQNILVFLKMVTKNWVLQRYFMPYGVKDQRDTSTPP